jgi:ipoprotein LpqH
MDNRRAALAAAMVVVGVSGCAAPASALGTRTAQVSIDGKDTGIVHSISCTQTGWNWLIDSPGADSGFSAALRTGASLAADWVQIRDLGGFTGSYWAGTVGDGKASISGQKFTISGTAHGFFADHPTRDATVPFVITTAC